MTKWRGKENKIPHQERLEIPFADLSPALQQDSLVIDHTTKIIRKPEPVGIETRTMASVSPRVILQLELQEGKHAREDRKNPYLVEAQKSAGCAR